MIFKSKASCLLWQYRLWSFQERYTKLERFLAKNQHTQRKLMNFQNWSSGELSKIGHHFRKKWFKNGSYQKMSITKIVLLNSYFSMKKRIRKIPMIFEIENWLWKFGTFWHLPITPIRKIQFCILPLKNP